MNGGMGKIMKQLQKAQTQMAKMQEQLGEKTCLLYTSRCV